MCQKGKRINSKDRACPYRQEKREVREYFSAGEKNPIPWVCWAATHFQGQLEFLLLYKKLLPWAWDRLTVILYQGCVRAMLWYLWECLCRAYLYHIWWNTYRKSSLGFFWKLKTGWTVKSYGRENSTIPCVLSLRCRSWGSRKKLINCLNDLVTGGGKKLLGRCYIAVSSF